VWPEGPSAPDYKLSAMRSYLEAGDRQKAQAMLDDIKTNFKSSAVAVEAARLFSEKSSSQAGS
jgi:hypothetical protein